jgi:hypothetical protein
VYLAPNPSLVQHGAQAVRLGKLETLDELYDKLFHGIEEITGEPKVEFELVILGRRRPALVSPYRIEI